jgi:hypothetical protein
MFKRLAVLSLLFLFSLPLAAAAQPPPDQPSQASAPSAAPPSSAVTARFSTFLSQVLVGKMPSGNLSPKLKSGLTPQLFAQLRNSVSSYGTFRRLEFVSQDSVQEYQRYRYTAVFDNGSQGFMFVTDSSGDIVGFFEGPSQ